jgi:hypothetical protein
MLYTDLVHAVYAMQYSLRSTIIASLTCTVFEV